MQDRFAHFFVHSPLGLMEIEAATVHPTADSARLTPPWGYFIVARLWDAAYIEEISRISGARVSLLGSVLAPDAGSKEPVVRFSKELKDWQGNTVAVLEASFDSALAAAVRRTNRNITLLLMVFFVIMGSGILLALYLSVLRPLRLVSQAVAMHEAGQLGPLEKQADEFGVLARLIAASFRQEHELYGKDEQLRAIFEAAQDCVFIKDVSLRYVQVNPAMERLFGIGSAQLIGATDEQLFGKDASRHTEEVDRLVLAGEPVSEEHIKPVKGVPLVFHVVKTPLRDAQGKVIGLCGIARDVTFRKQAEAALLEKQEQVISHQQALLSLAKVEFEDFATALKKITETASRVLQVERAGIWFFSPDRKTIICEDLYCRGLELHERGMTLEVTDYPAYFSVLEQSRVIAADDAQLDARTSAFKDTYLAPFGIVALMAIPVWHRAKLTGVFSLEHTGPKRSWKPQEQDFASAVTDLVVLELERDERRKIEQKLAEWAQRFALVASASGQITYDYEILTGKISWGSAIEKVLGYAPQEMSGGFAQWKELLHPDDRQEALERLRKAQESCAFRDIQYRMRHKNGSYVWLSDRGYFIPGADGNAERQVGVLEDITQRKLAEQCLIESEVKFRTLVELSPIAVSIHRDGKFIYVNSAGVRLLGAASSQDLVGRDSFDFVHPDVRGRASELSRKVMDTGEPLESWETRGLRLNGEEINIQLSESRIIYEGVPALQIVSIDITQRKRIEESLKRKMHELEVFVRASVDRELQMKELKKKLTQLEDTPRP